MTPSALDQHTPVLSLWWLLSLLQSWAQALPWSSWSCQPLCHLLGLWSSCAVSTRGSTVVTCQPPVVPPHWHRVTALSLAQVSPTSLLTGLTHPWPKVAKSHRNAGATETQSPSQSPSQSLPSRALETLGPVLGQRKGHGPVALLGDSPEGRQFLEKAVLGLVPQAGDSLPRCPWVPACRVAGQVGGLGVHVKS